MAIGQTVIIPDGVKPADIPWSGTARVKQITPTPERLLHPETLSGLQAERLLKDFKPTHKGLDIANKAGPGVLAADSGTVVVAGWPDGYGYGNRVVIDHGNGYRTLYAHLQTIYVVSGQTVKRGDAIGKMGSTGRSTGTHLHFEVNF